MKKLVDRSKLVHFTFADVVVDDFWHLKNRTHLDSPFVAAQLEYWFSVQDLFDFLPCDLPYWQNPPTLELPERAESLQDNAHCWFCGFPLDTDVAPCEEIQERGFTR